MQAGHAIRELHLLYHELSPEPRAYGYSMQTARFAEHLQLLRSLQDSGNAIQPRITFDDGHRSNYDHALPLLQEHGLTASFFLTAGWIGERAGYLDCSQARALLQAGHTVGAHGWSHALLPQCSTAELRHELQDSRRLLEDRLGVAVTTLSFPGGRYNARVLAACAHAGYTTCFTSRPGLATPGQQGLTGRLNLRRDTTAAWLQRLFQPDGPLLASLQRQDRIKTSLQRLLGDRVYGSLWRVVNRAEAGAEA